MSAVELERLLDHDPTAAVPVSKDGPGAQRGLMPGGISAWTVDATRNRLGVAGSDGAIRELNSIVALLDVPPRQIRLSASVMSLDADAVRKLGVELSSLYARVPDGTLLRVPVFAATLNAREAARVSTGRRVLQHTAMESGPTTTAAPPGGASCRSPMTPWSHRGSPETDPSLSSSASTPPDGHANPCSSARKRSGG